MLFNTLDRYILKKFIKNFIGMLLGTLVIFFSLPFFSIVEASISGTITLLEIPILTLKTIAPIISYESIHFSSLLAAMITMYDMNKNLELISLKTSGVSFGRIIRLPMIFAILCSFFIIFFTNTVSVRSSRGYNKIMNRASGRQISKNRNNVYYRSDNRYFRIANLNGYNATVRNFQMVTVEDNKVVEIFNAHKGKYDEKDGWLFDNVIVNKVEKSEIIEHDSYRLDIKESLNDFLDYILVNDSGLIDTAGGVDEQSIGRDKTFRELLDKIAILRKSGGDDSRLNAHLHHHRISYPFSIAIMVLIGFVLLKGFSRAGKAGEIMIGIALGYGYYTFIQIFYAVGFAKVLPIIVSAWLPNLIFLAIGIFYFFDTEE